MTTESAPPKELMWPALPYAEWKDTCETLHMWTQIVGKVRLALSPFINHWWEVPFYVSARGLTTSAIPYRAGVFEAEFDFIEHALRIETSTGETDVLDLGPRSVANFYKEFMASLKSLGIDVKIWPMAVEVPESDSVRSGYDACVIRSRVCRALFSYSDDTESDFSGVSRAIHRQGQPSAFFLGQLRSCSHAIFGAAGAGAAGGGHNYAGGLLARGEQRWLVAGRRRCGQPGVLFIRGACARWIQRLPGEACAGPVRREDEGVPAGV